MCCTKKIYFLKKIAPCARDTHAYKMAYNFYNFAREEISWVPTLKDLDSHNEKVTIERHEKLEKHIDHITLRVKSKRHQNDWAACVATVD